MPDPLQLSEMLCARLCHDLSGPLGALLGAVELGVEQGEGKAEAMAVAADSALTLGRRLRLFRAAWAGDASAMSVGEIQEIATGLGSGSRIEFDFAGLDPSGALPPGSARVLLNVLLLAMEGIAGAGRIAVTGAADILVMIAGPRARWPAGLATFINDEAAAWDALTNARSVQAPFTALVARRAGLRLSLLLPTGAASDSVPPLLLAPDPSG